MEGGGAVLTARIDWDACREQFLHGAEIVVSGDLGQEMLIGRSRIGKCGVGAAGGQQSRGFILMHLDG